MYTVVGLTPLVSTPTIKNSVSDMLILKLMTNHRTQPVLTIHISNIHLNVILLLLNKIFNFQWFIVLFQQMDCILNG